MQLRDYQLNSIQSIFTYYEAGNKGNPLVALPTGTGKSATIAGLIYRIMYSWPSQRILVAAHAAELLKQNSATLERMWPEVPYGIYSAELRRKETIYPITFVGIGSVSNFYASFGHIDVLIVDEAHLISDTEGSMYQRFIAGLRETNPNLIVVGFTATPYRMKVGLITDGTIFDDTVYDLTSYDNFNDLVAKGYLAPLVSRPTRTEYDLSEVGTVAGEYNQKDLAKAVSKSEITQKAVQELIQAGIDRNCGIIFGDSIEHAEEIAAFLRAEGESAGVVHSKQGKSLNDEILAAHREGALKWLVNKDKLTTGYDWPPLDICGMLRHTLSPGLWVQMLGRLTRPYDWMIEHQYKPGFNYTKGNALVLDFARNSERLGPVNDPKLPRKKGKGTGDAPIRICDACGTYNHASARICDGCGEPFTFKPKISEAPSRAEVMKSPLPIVESYLVKRATYKAIRKPGSPPMLLAEYQCDYFAPFSEIVGIEAPEGSWQRRSSKEWWSKRLAGDVPTTVDDALRAQAMLKTPRSIKVHVNNMPRAKVLNAEF